MSLTRIKPIPAPPALAVMAFSRLQAEVGLKHCGALLSRGASHAWRARAAIGITCWRFVHSPTRSSLTKTASMILVTTMSDSYLASRDLHHKTPLVQLSQRCLHTSASG